MTPRTTQTDSKLYKLILFMQLLVTIALLISIFFSHRAEAQSVLPKGIGVIRAGYRHMSNPSLGFDSKGELQNIGRQYKTELSGAEMLKGALGAEPKRLADELAKFDSESTGEQSLVKRLTLGTMDPSIEVKMKAYYFGIGYGVTDTFTAYFGIPIVNVSVNADFRYSGNNNALEIKQELGELGFDELKEGLDTASQVNANTILDTIAKSDYSTAMTWNAQQPGDGRVGIFLDPLRYFGYTGTEHESAFNLELNIPTGYRDRPERLIDTTLGRGAYALYASIEDKIYWGNLFWIHGLAGGVAAFPTKIEKRVPTSDDSFPDKSRQAATTWNQGFEYEGRGGAGLAYSLFDFGIFAHQEQHFKDTYSGSMKGNYGKLAEDSDWNLLSVESVLTFSTVSLFKTGAFSIPFLAKLLWKHPLSGRNKLDDDYVELTLTSFFSTPFRATPTEGAN